MTHCGPMKIVLVLMLFVYISVWSLETGYDYTTKHISNYELHKDLKCGYMFNGCTHMRVFKLLLEEPYNTEFKWLTGYIGKINNIVKSQIVSLLGLNGIRIGAMWLLHLFTGLVNVFYQESKNPTGDYPKIVETLVYVINKLDADLAGCRQGNLFDWYDSVLESRQTFGFYTYKKIIFIRHFGEAKAQLQNNHIISNSLLKERLEMNTKTKSLFLNNLGLYDKLKDDLQNVYNLRMKWNDTSSILYKAWVNARYLDWTKTNLYPIKLYYKACYDFLKIIMFRLTLKHITYLLHYTVNSGPYFYYAQEWYKIVVQFGTMLKLTEDSHVHTLLNALRNLINGIETIASVVSFLVAILVTLCQTFGCDASNQFAVDNREFTTQYTSLTEEEIKSLKITVSAVWIEYNSLENAKTFLSHLELAFSTVNFSVIRLLTDYIDELNPINGVVRSEECTEELEILHLNISDFD